MVDWVEDKKWEIGGLGREVRGRVTNISYDDLLPCYAYTMLYCGCYVAATT